MSVEHFGSCLCGDVEFKIDGDFESFYLCHCKRCRKDTGSAHAANLFSTTAKITWLSGEDKTTLFNLSSTRHVKCFCSVCGSALPSVQMNGKLLVVPAGSLNSQLLIKPNAHIFVSSKASWDECLDNIPKCDDGPV
ncbi:GFA family protein [Zooshikella sp. RANM57]|uniref:GFA family protein n=1 Tax=Zooshikella sp. RANM57 TaxID=3425863 RepID=UPI003D6ED0D0